MDLALARVSGLTTEVEELRSERNELTNRLEENALSLAELRWQNARELVAVAVEVFEVSEVTY